MCNWYLDVFAHDELDASFEMLCTMRRLHDYDPSLPCEDDSEVTAPFIGLMPEETGFDKEEPSPLDFGGSRRHGEIARTSLASNVFPRPIHNRP